jgi:hypothetical protein
VGNGGRSEGGAGEKKIGINHVQKDDHIKGYVAKIAQSQR